MEIRAKKSLGQHFLNSPSVLKKIIDAAAIIPDEMIMEIGPGTGILTKPLLETGAKVTAVEKDDRSYDLLREKFSTEAGNEKFFLYGGDILEMDRRGINLSEGKYALVANIPYYITGAILESFLEHEPRPNRAVLLVQKEVAERIVAKDGKESLLSISVKAFGAPRYVDTVPRGAFVPAPNVDSAILAIGDISDRRFREKNLDISHFFAVLKAGFAHKRKLVKRNLEDALPRTTIDAIWLTKSLDEKARAEDLTLEQWFDIASGDKIKA